MKFNFIYMFAHKPVTLGEKHEKRAGIYGHNPSTNEWPTRGIVYNLST